MAVERTFSIIKPDATRRNLTGKINARFEDKGLRIVAQKRIWMTRGQAEQFYGVHNAAAGTIRKDFAESIEANSVHGSDSPENAAAEIAYFFGGLEIVG